MTARWRATARRAALGHKGLLHRSTALLSSGQWATQGQRALPTSRSHLEDADFMVEPLQGAAALILKLYSDPARRSFRVLDTSTRFGAAVATTRAATWTAMPFTSCALASISPTCRPALTLTPIPGMTSTI